MLFAERRIKDSMWRFNNHQDDERFVRRVRIIAVYAVGVIIVALLATFLIYRYEDVASLVDSVMTPIRPVIFGLIIAYLLSPVQNAIQSFLEIRLRRFKFGKTLSRILGIGLAILIGLGAIVALVYLIIPGLVDSISKLAASLPSYVQEIQTWITGLQHGSVELKNTINTIIARASDAFENWMQNDFTKDITNIMTQVTTGVVDVVKFVFNFLVGFVISVYVLRDKELIKYQANKLGRAFLSEKTLDKVTKTLRQGDRIFGGFIHGKILDSLVIGMICFIGLSIMQMPYTLLVSVIVGVTNIIPFFGPLLGAVPSAFLILLADPLKCLYFLIFIIVLQQLDGNIIGPRIVGNNIGLNEFWVTFSLLLFGGIFGFFGMVVGVPIFALVYYLVVQFLNHKLEKKELEKNKTQGDHQMKFGDKDIYTLKAGGYTAWAVPALGGQMMGLSKDGIQALHEPVSPEDTVKGSTSYGFPILFPPNRIDGGHFTLRGREFQFPLNEPARNNSLHGFLHKRPWKVEEAADNLLRMSFTGDENTDFFSIFPVKFKVEQLYELDETGLSQTITVTNTGSDPLPLGLGFHSAFVVDPDSRVLLSVGKRIEVTDRMLPSGVVRELSEEEAPLRKEGLDPMAWEMDDHYTVKALEIDGKPFHGALISRDGATVRYQVDDFYRHWMIWNCKKKGGFICLEPQNWRIDAPNLVNTIGEDSGFDVLEPGQTISVKAHLSIEK